MKNILFVHSSSELYGSDRSLLNIVKGIDKNKYKIFVILPCEGPLVEEIKKIKDVNVDIYEIAVLRRKNLSFKGLIKYTRDFVRSTSYIKKYIRKNKIDIVDTNTAVVFPGAVAAKCCRVKSVWHIRELITNKIEKYVISFMMTHFANIIIANSKATGEVLKVDKNKIRVIYNAVEDNKNVKPISHDALTIGMAGRINHWKGQKLFVDAAEIVHKVIPSAIFKIAGDVYIGEEYLREELIQYIHGKNLQDTVQLLGQVNDMEKFYRSIDVFVLPSIQPEPFGLVVIEAMEYGIPVIATNHGGPVEIISNNIDGYLVDYSSPNQMAERIIELLLDEKKRKNMGKKGIEKKHNNFSVSSMVSKIEKVFDEVINI